MDYFQGVVAEYLRADRSCFLNTEFYLQNDFSPAEETAKTWFVDILCVNMRAQEAHLCEVTYAKNPQGLLKRLTLLWHFWFIGFRDEHFTMRASQGRRSCEEIEDGLPDRRHAGLWRRTCDSFFSVPLL